jgi:hypothetical protein
MPTRDQCPACLKPWVRCRCAQWCRECGCVTNHTTQQHLEAQESNDATVDED